MLPSKNDILLTIDRNGSLGDFAMRSADVISEYILILFNSLRKNDFISGNKWTGYRLTGKGKEYIKRHPLPATRWRYQGKPTNNLPLYR